MQHALTVQELQNVDNPDFSLAAMRIAVADKKQRRAKKGLAFNCLVFDRGTCPDEFLSFLKFLEEKKSQIHNGMRFQIIYRAKFRKEKYHWSTADICIKDGKLEFYLIDAANNFLQIIPTISAIYRLCPDAIIRYSGGQLQMDGHNCPTFAFDHACRLAKIPNLHEDLCTLEHKGAIGDFPEYSAYLFSIVEQHPEILVDGATTLHALLNVKYVSLNNFPAHFGSLVRNMQDYPNLFENFFSKKMQGNDVIDLELYVKKHAKIFTKSSLSEMRNYAIDAKRKTIKANAEKFLATLDEATFASIVSSPSFAALTNPEISSSPAKKIKY